MTDFELNVKLIEITADLAIISSQAEQRISEINCEAQRAIAEIWSIANQQTLQVVVESRAQKIKLNRKLLELTNAQNIQSNPERADA